jgi:type II secretory pathway component GspD/PulD (secretin)
MIRAVWTGEMRASCGRGKPSQVDGLQVLIVWIASIWWLGMMLGSVSTARAHEVAVDFENVDLRVFIKFVSEVTGRVFLLDERVRGQVSVRFANKIPVEELYDVLESVLEVKGFAAVPAGAVTKIVPLGTAKQRGIEFQGRNPRSAGER